jgi:hypothetical protein
LAHPEAVAGFTATLIEKDYYCSSILQYLYGGDTSLVFKGGTCLSKVSDLIGHHCKTSPGFSGPGRFYRGVQRQKIGLKRDLIDGLDNFGGLFTGPGDFIHGGGKTTHGIVGLPDHLIGFFYPRLRYLEKID